MLWDASLPEIRAIVAAPDGTIYAAAMGGSVARQSQAAQGAGAGAGQGVTVQAPTISVTVTEESAQGGVQIQPKPPAAAAQTPTPPPASPVVEYAGIEKSALYRIRPDNTVETVWSSKEENAYDIAAGVGGAVLIATDGRGRVYRLDADRKATLVAETRESEALRLLAARNGMLVATGNLGKLYRLGEQGVAGTFESPVHDATTVARWGRLSWQQQSCGGCEVAFRTRTGNTARPDMTWSDWSVPLRDGDGSAIASPNARFVQWKAEFKGTVQAGPALDSVRLAYLPQNTPPAVRSVTVSAQTASAGAAKLASTPAPATAVYSVTVTDTGEAGASSLSGTATQPITRASQEQILVSWAGEDTDGDKLTYSLHFRGEQEREWKLLRAYLTETQWTIDAESLADGRYYFKVTASDRGTNPPENAREADLVSAPVLVDRTPPVVKASSSRTGNTIEVIAEADDAGSPLKGCEYAVNAGPWTAVAAEDGIADSRRERFLFRIDAAEGERIVVVRATDSAGNAGLARLVLR